MSTVKSSSPSPRRPAGLFGSTHQSPSPVATSGQKRSPRQSAEDTACDAGRNSPTASLKGLRTNEIIQKVSIKSRQTKRVIEHQDEVKSAVSAHLDHKTTAKLHELALQDFVNDSQMSALGGGKGTFIHPGAAQTPLSRKTELELETNESVRVQERRRKMEEALVPLGLMSVSRAHEYARGTSHGPIRTYPTQRVATGTNDNASSGYSQAGGGPGRIPQLLMRHELMSELYRQGSAVSPHQLNEIRQAQFKPFSTLSFHRNMMEQTPDTAQMLPKKRTKVSKKREIPPPPVPEIVASTRTPVNYDWSQHSLRPPFAFRRDDMVANDPTKPRRLERFSIRVINELNKDEYIIEQKLNAILKHSLIKTDSKGMVLTNPQQRYGSVPRPASKPDASRARLPKINSFHMYNSKQKEDAQSLQMFNRDQGPMSEKGSHRRSPVAGMAMTGRIPSKLLEDSSVLPADSVNTSYVDKKRQTNMWCQKSDMRTRVTSHLPSDPDGGKQSAELTFQESQRGSGIEFEDSRFRTTHHSVVEGEVVNFGAMARDVLINVDTAANSLANQQQSSPFEDHASAKKIKTSQHFVYGPYERSDYFKSGKSPMRTIQIEQKRFSVTGFCQLPGPAAAQLEPAGLRARKMTVLSSAKPAVKEQLRSKVATFKKDTSFDAAAAAVTPERKTVESIMRGTAASLDRKTKLLESEKRRAARALEKASGKVRFRKVEDPESEEDPDAPLDLDSLLTDLRHTEPVSPRDVNLTLEQVQQLKMCLHLQKQKMTRPVTDLLVELSRYYSQYCKYTGNIDYLNAIITKFQRGFMNVVTLRAELKQIQERYVYLAHEDFCAKYERDQLQRSCDKPSQNRERYMLNTDVAELIQFADNLVYYKKKLVREVGQPPQTPVVYLNMVRKDENGHADESYKLTKFYQNQPTLCCIALMASRVLLNYYIDDDRYKLDIKEAQRLGLVKGRRASPVEPKPCTNHGKGEDAQKVEQAENVKRTEEFMKALSEKKKAKITASQWMGQLVDIIRSSTEPEFVEFREKLLDKSNNRDMTYDDLRRLNPLIFLKERPPEVKIPVLREDVAPDEAEARDSALREYLFKEEGMKPLRSLAGSQSIRVNSLILETFVTSICEKLQDRVDTGYESVRTPTPAMESGVTTPTPAYLQAPSQTASQLQRQMSKTPEKIPTTPLNEAHMMIQNGIANSISKRQTFLFKDRFETAKFYAEQKIRRQNPKGIDSIKNRFFERQQKDCSIGIPIFSKIMDSRLDLAGYGLDDRLSKALACYIEGILQQLEQEGTPDAAVEECRIKLLRLEDNGLRDEDFARILTAVNSQGGHLERLVYAGSTNVLGEQSLQAIMRTFDRLSEGTGNLNHLTIAGVKTERRLNVQLLQTIAEVPYLRTLQLQRLDLLDSEIIDSLCSFIQENRRCHELDLSGCSISKKHLMQLGEALVAEEEEPLLLAHLNLSYINVDGIQNSWKLNMMGEPADYISPFLENLCTFIRSSRFLTHLDLSGMNLRDRTELIASTIVAACEHGASKLVGVHLNDNGMENSTKDYIIEKMRLQTFGTHQQTYRHLDPTLQMTLNIEQQVTEGGKLAKQLHKFFKTPMPDEIVDGQTEQQMQLGLIKSDLARGLQKENREGTRIHNTVGSRDVFILTRLMGHPELFFRQSIESKLPYESANLDGRWSVHTREISHDDVPCYYCQNHSYVQVHYARGDRRYKALNDAQMEAKLRKALQVPEGSINHGNGAIMMSSVNGWLATRLVDVRVYCQILKANMPAFKFNHCWRLRRQNEDLVMERRELQIYLFNELKAEAKRKRGDQKGVQLDMPYKKEHEVPSEDARKRRDNLDKNMVQNCTDNLVRAITGEWLEGQQRMVYREEPVSFIERDGDDSAELFDRFTDKDWRFINDSCHLLPNDEIIRVNEPAEGKNDVPMIFAGFVRPGRHPIVIYDCKLDRFFTSEAYVNSRRHQLSFHRTPQLTTHHRQKEATINPEIEPDELLKKKFVAAIVPKYQYNITLGGNYDLPDADPAEAHEPIVDGHYFVFNKAWLMTSENLQSLMLQDFANIQQMPDIIGAETLKENWLTVMDGMKKYYKALLHAHRMYICTMVPICETTPDKYKNFLVRFFDVKPDLGDFNCERVNRATFIYLLHAFTLQQSKSFEAMHKEVEKMAMRSFVTWEPEKEAYHMNLGEYGYVFRRQWLWTTKVSMLFIQNRQNLDLLYSHFKDKSEAHGKFTIDSALKMLAAAKVKLQMQQPVYSHLHMVHSLFALSKQLQVVELAPTSNVRYSYETLTYQEFLEFIARLSVVVFPEAWAREDETKPVAVCIMATQQLSYKIYQLLKDHLLVPLGRDGLMVGEGPVLDARAERVYLKKRAKEKKAAKKLAQQQAHAATSSEANVDSNLVSMDHLPSVQEENEDGEGGASDDGEENKDGPCMLHFKRLETNQFII